MHSKTSRNTGTFFFVLLHRFSFSVAMNTIEQLHQLFLNGAPICTDTRSITSGSLFFALKGAQFNGNTFAAKALEAGAVAVVVDEAGWIPEGDHVFLVDDALKSLQDLAHHHRKQFNIPVIGITGSNGKTTTKELLNKVLSQKLRVLCTKGNLNNHIGVPLTLLGLNNTHELAIIEMGANHQREIELLCNIAAPTHVLITNVGKAHLEGFGGFEGVKKGKGEMYVYAKENQSVVFINRNNPHLISMLGSYDHVVSYGTDPSNEVCGTLIDNNSHVALDWRHKELSQKQHIQSHITGNYNFENILSAIAAGMHFGVNPQQINEAIASYIPDNQRSQEISKGSNHIVLDAYNANPTSMEAAIRNFDKNFKGPRAVFLGDMFELGESSAAEHKTVLELVKSCRFDKVVLVGPRFKEAGASATDALFFENSAAASDWLRQNPLKNYNVLIKGSRSSKMEVVLEAFETV